MDIARLSIFMTASLALLLTPGPAVLYIVARSVEQGRRAGLVSVLGIEAGGLFHVGAATAGLSAILMSSALAFDIVKYLGAAYLITMGIRTLRAKDVPTDVVIERKSYRQLFTQGVVVNVLNPKTALFFFAFLPQFVDPALGSVSLQFLILGMIFVGLATVTDSGYAIAAGTAGSWLQRNRHFQRVQRAVAGMVYIGLGITAAFASPVKK
jgi:threonine/homoserine/homoserine lactone efflux protein